MKKFFLIVCLFCFAFITSAQVKLTHNIGDYPIETIMFSCSETEHWARDFKLSDFGIFNTKEFIVKSGQVAISRSYGGAKLKFNIYSIDSNFPESFNQAVLLGSSQTQIIPQISNGPEIVQVDFTNPVYIPAGVNQILVEVEKTGVSKNPAVATAFISGTAFDNGISWYKGCGANNSYAPSFELSPPRPNVNFFINIEGGFSDDKDHNFSTTLSHNPCGELIKTINNSCSYSHIYTARDFKLEDYGISENEEYIISEGQLAFSYAESGAAIQFNIYKIDDNFPISFSETDDLLGSSQMVDLPYFNSGSSGGYIETVTVNFDVPVVVPAGTDRILVEVFKGLLGGGSGLLHIAGTKEDDGAPTWYKGCLAGLEYVNSDEMTTYSQWPGKDYNFYINVKGEVNHISNNFEMNISNICSDFLKEFTVENKDNIASIVWDFGDPASGSSNTSINLSPFHDFSSDGTYTITATVTAKDASVHVFSETIDVTEPPQAFGINNIYACEDQFTTGISSLFNTSGIVQQVLGGQTNKLVKFITSNGSQYDVLPNPYTNSVKNKETITVRVAHQNNPCCYSETSFDLIVQPKPNLESIEDLIVCESETSGFASFNLEKVKENIIVNRTNIEVEFYFENGQKVDGPLNDVENIIAYEEVITALVTNTDTYCDNKTTFKLKANPLPIANPLADLIGCDDNNDGISEYFDTSNIEVDVLGGQTNMEVSYFDHSGNQLPNPLPNPFTNKTTNQETITVRVTNLQTNCYAETTLVLNTASQPRINKPQPLYGCDLGNGFANFDTSSIETQLIGNQSGLKIIYSDSNGNLLPSPLPITFQNAQSWTQNMKIRVENELNSLCFSETNFDLIVNELPTVNIDESYFLCNLEPYLNISVEKDLDTYEWKYQDGTTVSNTSEANLVDAGNYSLTIGKNINGIYCENQFNFELIRSVLPTITEVLYKELSDDNYIEIFVSGDGDFEYSIDGYNYQSSHRFDNIQGGVYAVSVRDKLGCGEDFDEVTVIDYPKYFTPNGDGINDIWQIKGVSSYPNAAIFIYDRYGKLLRQITANSTGWDGTYKNEKLADADYWFTVELNSEHSFSGHFSLKR